MRLRAIVFAGLLGQLLCADSRLRGSIRHQEPVLIETFQIHELFGVRHPKQIIDFDFAKPMTVQNSYMTGPNGLEVPFQILHDHKIAVEAELPPYAEATWKLYSGRAPTPFPNIVRVAQQTSFYEITNGLTGVRITRACGNPCKDRAPIQGILYRDGAWTAAGPNFLSDAAGVRLAAKTMDVRFIDNGPLKVAVELSYAFHRPALVYGGKILIPAGAGFYRSTIELQAGQPSLLIEDDTDMDLRYRLDVFAGLHPDQARYRGHHSTSIENGREPDGRQYRMWHERPPMDALRDLQYTTPAPSSYTSTHPYIRRMAIWDPWVFDSGWYWMLYDSHADAHANLLGIFAGRVSEAIGAANSGPGIFTAPAPPNGQPVAGITFESNRRSPDARLFPRVRISWGIFIGTKSHDLRDPYQVQNIARQMNLHAGINLNKVYRYQTSFDDPPAGYRPLYMSREATAKLVQRVRTDPDYYKQLYNAEPTARPLLDTWRDTSGQKLENVVENVTAGARNLLDALVNGDGIYDFHFHYWHGGLEMSRQAVWINSVLTSDIATAEDKARVKAAAVVFANVLWDSDFVPLFDGHGLNLGTANMPVQQSEYRDLYALLLAHHPMMSGRVASACRNALSNLHHTINESGAHMGSTSYIGASMGPLLSTLQQLKTAGITDAFKTEDRLRNFAEFYLNLLTPPEPRFGGYRKLISVGDASTQSSELYGQLATGFADDDPALSSRLMAAWLQSGAMHSGFHGSTLLKIDDTLPPQNAHLTNANFPGWYTVLRNGWATLHETAVWLVDGDFYRDHAHEDNGTVVIYALGAPLSIDWGSMYSPQVPGAFMHSLVIPENVLHAPWSQNNTSLAATGFRWQNAAPQAFESFSASAHIRATYNTPDGTTWTRSIYSLHPDENHPVLVIRDSFSGQDAAANKISTLNLMASAAGSIPQATVLSLPPGLNKFEFTGQWLIDWNLYTLSTQPLDATLGSWSHNWHPSREQSEFQKANGFPFRESQYIFRVRGTSDFETLLVPYRKGENPETTVTANGPEILITRNRSTATFDGHCFTYTDGPSTVLTSFGPNLCKSSQMSIEGGPAEVAVNPQQVTITAHGAAGVRTINLHGRKQLLNYAGGGLISLSLPPAPLPKLSRNR